MWRPNAVESWPSATTPPLLLVVNVKSPSPDASLRTIVLVNCHGSHGRPSSNDSHLALSSNPSSERGGGTYPSPTGPMSCCTTREFSQRCHPVQSEFMYATILVPSGISTASAPWM